MSFISTEQTNKNHRDALNFVKSRIAEIEHPKMGKNKAFYVGELTTLLQIKKILETDIE